MPKRKPRKSRPHSQSQDEDPHTPQNPKMTEEEELQMQNPNSIQEEDLQIHNTNSIEEELQIQNPSLIEGEQCQQPQKSQNEEQDHDFDQETGYPEDRQQEEEEKQQDQEEPEGMALSPTPATPPAHDISMPDLIADNPPPTVTSVYRRAPKRKKPLTQRKRVALEKKLQTLKENIQPIPFVPGKILDFSKHEKLFKRLGLWDFAHLEFDHNIRIDLLALLITNYNPSSRCSVVNECRIMVNRADLARALKLPVKKDKMNLSETLDSDPEVISKESISFLEDFVSNWILLHEDMWMMPNEILTWIEFIKQGQPQKVDWPGLIWFMVEKELLQAPELGSCYYASHLQCLMKSQRDDLFKEEPKGEPPIEEEEDIVDVKMRNLEDFQEQELERQPIELTLGHDKNESKQQVRDDDVMDFQECNEDPVGPAQWFLNGKNNIDEHYLQRCNLNEVGGLGGQIKEDEEEEEDEEKYDLSSKCTGPERLASTDFLPSMETTDISYSAPPVHFLDHSSGDLLQSRDDSHMNQGVPMCGNSCKREISLEDDARHHSLNDHPKRIRNDGTWEYKSSDFDVCMGQVQSLMTKARMMYEAKEQASTDAHLNQQLLVSELQRRDIIIENLQKINYEERQKGGREMYKLERELYVMTNLLESYRKALKETRRAFSEYRERCQQLDEPLYKDVSGTGGVVLSTMELEKQRLEREEEERIQHCMIEEKIKDFQLGWFGELEVYLNKVHLLGKRLSDFEEEVKLLKETSAKHKISET